MLFCNEIPHLRIYRQKTYLPIDKREQNSSQDTSKNSIIFINNNTTASAIGFLKSQFFTNNSKFHYYYMDLSYRGQIFNRGYRVSFRTERNAIYNQINAQVKTPLTTIPNLSGGFNKNLFFDMFEYNDIFFKYSQKLTFKVRVTQYVNFLKNIINDARFSSYNIKSLFIDVNDWVTDIKKINPTQVKNNYNNAVFMLLYCMYKDINKFKELGNIDIIFFSDNSALRVNPSLCDLKSYQLVKREITKLSPHIPVKEDDSELDKNVKIQEIRDNVTSQFAEMYRFTGDDNKEFNESITQRIDEIIEKNTDTEEQGNEDLKDKIENELINDLELMKQVSQFNQEQKTGRTTTSLKRDEELRNKQKEIVFRNKRIDELTNLSPNAISIPSIDISDKVKTTNSNITKVRYPNFEKTYNEHLFHKDLMSNITCLNDKSIPVFIRDIKVEDTSDELNLKDTYSFDLEDSNRVRHRLKFDIPKFIDDKFMYLGGNKKLIVKQLFMKPVVKNGPDTVRVCSNYNIIFVMRYGKKLSSKVEKFKKFLSAVKTGLVVKYGNNIAANSQFKSLLEYDEISKDISYIKTKNCEFFFNQIEVQDIIKQNNIKIPDGKFCIGFFNNSLTEKGNASTKQPILMDLDSQTMDGGEYDIIDYIIYSLEGNLVKQFEDTTVGKKYMYTRAKIMSKHVPLILLLGYVEGLSTVLRKANIRHQFSDKRPTDLSVNQGVVKFADGYLIYDKYPFENSLLMNAFADIPTSTFNYVDFDSKSAYLSIFDIMFNTKIIGNAFDNFYEFMIDPITKEVLADLNYPTDFVGLMIFVNSLLADNSFIKENDMNVYRVRSNEMVNAVLYKAIADAYSQYRMTANNNNPVKISIPQDAVIKKLLMAQTVEDYSILNPIVELEKSRAITPKGHSGLNVDEAYTQEKRSYDDTMLGILALSTSPDANCGVVRQLTLEPNIISPRGYIDLKNDKLGELNDANLFSPAELLSPLGVTRDDSIRTAMATKQSKHIIPIAKASPVLISNGVEQVIHHHLSTDFVITAKQDGEVVEVDDSTGLTIVEYKDGTTQAIDTKPRVVKNGAGGFYLSNKLTCNLKKGDKFKKLDILASDEHFFTESKIDGNRFNIGSLQKVACMSTYSTYEDSTFITRKLSKDAASQVIMQKAEVLGKNANVDFMVKVGDTVHVGDELIRYELSFEEDSINKFLASVGDELKEEIKSMGKKPVKSKYSGVIEDIKIYSTVELEELSPSLQKIVGSYYNKLNQRRKVLSKYDNIAKIPAKKGVDVTQSNSNDVYKCGILLNEPVGKVEAKNDKVKGHEVGEGVLIEFYIKYKDMVGVGDKITFFTALKSIVGEVIEDGLEPYSEFRPDEEITSVIAPGAVLKYWDLTW